MQMTFLVFLVREEEEEEKHLLRKRKKKQAGVFLLVLGGALSPGLLRLLLSPGPAAPVVAGHEGPS